jgi:hypothetical protein
MSGSRSSKTVREEMEGDLEKDMDEAADTRHFDLQHAIVHEFTNVGQRQKDWVQRDASSLCQGIRIYWSGPERI